MEEKKNIMELVKSSPITKVLSIPEVKEKFIRVYEQAHGVGKGELAYQKNFIIFSDMIKAQSFANVSTIQLYKTWIMIAARGYDLDSTEGEVYILPYNTEIQIQKQAPYLVRKLKESKQIKEVYPAQLIYKGDLFQIIDGMVKNHERKLQSSEIVAGYVIVEKYNNAKVCFLYTPENWNAWKKKSKMPNAENWSGGINNQPVEAFLKTKIVLHAMKEKSWASSRPVLTEDFFPEIEKDDETTNETPEAEIINTDFKEIKDGNDEF